MDEIQVRLAGNLRTLIERVAARQRERMAAGKEPFDLYIAVTSTSVLVNRYALPGGVAGSCDAGVCSISSPTFGAPYSYACTPGLCADIVTRYYNSRGVTANVPGATCSPGVMKADGDLFPAGDFVAAGTNPKMLAFTRELDWTNASTDPAIYELVGRFRDNVRVGSCGSNQEMPFEAARRAIAKGLAGEQGAVWPHQNSRIGVVFISDEDDCSTRPADQGGLVWDESGAQESCRADAARETPLGLTPNAEYVSYFTGLGRPFSAAFVRPGFGDCVGTVANRPGTRMKALASALTAAGAGVVEASVCGDFGGTLAQIAALVEAPDWIALPEAATSGGVTDLRVSRSDGTTAHVCEGPDPAREWWFVDCVDGAAMPTGKTSGCVEIAAGSACHPAALETLEASYLGSTTIGGCSIRGS